MIVRLLAPALLAGALATSAGARQTAQRLGDLVPKPPSDVVVEDFARSAADLDDAAELLLSALGSGSLSRSDGERIVVEGPVEEAVRGAVELLGRGPFAPLVAATLEPAPTPAASEAELAPSASATAPIETRDHPEIYEGALRVLSIVGNRRDLTALFELSERIDDLRGEGTSASEVEESVAAIIARDARALAMLESLFAKLPFSSQRACVRAVGGSHDPGRQHWLAGRCGQDDSLTLSILSELARPTVLLVPLEERDLEVVREYLSSTNTQLRREATRACAALGDMGAVLPMVSNLSDDSAAVRDATRAALTELTQLRLGDDETRWMSWLDNEAHWYQVEAMRQYRRINLADQRVVLASLDIISTHRLYRDEIVLQIEPLFDSHNPKLRRAACNVLQRLGARTGLEHLVAALRDEDPSVANAAQVALRALTRSAPESAEDWLAVVAE